MASADALTSPARSSWFLPILISTSCGLLAFGVWSRLHARAAPQPHEPDLFKNHSSFQSLTTASGHTYPRIRILHHAHKQSETLPLLVFVHGLGGSATQFAPLLAQLVNVAPCIAIDLPGCGRSDFLPACPAAYTTAAFAELVSAAIDRYRDTRSNQRVVLVGHSMGCSIAALLASAASPIYRPDIIGMIAICPRANAPSPKEVTAVEYLRWVPAPLFDIMRFFDRGSKGLNSRSITRMVGEGADVETRRLQHQYNQQSKSAVILRYVTAAIPAQREGKAVPWPGKEIWEEVKVPLFLVAGEADHVNPPGEVAQIALWLREDSAAKPSSASVAGEEPGLPMVAGDAQLAETSFIDSSSQLDTAPAPQVPCYPTKQVTSDSVLTKHRAMLKTAIFPAPAAHAIMFATSTAGTLAGLIESFLARNCS